MGSATPTHPTAPSTSGLGRRFARLVRTRPLGMTGGAVVLLLLAMAVFAPALSPYDPVAQDAERVLHPPGALHWLGADNLGRDIWSRIAFGARVSLGVGILSVVLGSAAGALAGVVGGYYGRLADAILQQAADAPVGLPHPCAGVGNHGRIRHVHSQRHPGHRACAGPPGCACGSEPGASRLRRRIRRGGEDCRRRQPPGGAPPRPAALCRAVPRHLHQRLGCRGGAGGILELPRVSACPRPRRRGAACSPAPAATTSAPLPWMALWPGLAISLAVYGFNLLGDALRDILDPRQRPV